MGWYLPDTDPTVMYAINELARWVADNWVTILVITNILTALQWLAFRTKNVYDDKILTLLIYIVSFKWMKGLTAGLGTKENPIILKDEVKE
jgi:hypothetical protein